MKQQTHEPDVNIIKGERFEQAEGLSTHVAKSRQWQTRTHGAAQLQVERFATVTQTSMAGWVALWGGEDRPGEIGLSSLSDEEEREKRFW